MRRGIEENLKGGERRGLEGVTGHPLEGGGGGGSSNDPGHFMF